MTESFKAFVIMPFDPEFKSIFDDLIKPALEDAGYNVVRADSFLDQVNILRVIVREIATADLVVADLTTLNPNVLYELGLCHGMQIPTILLAQSMDEVPFDLRSYKIQIYSIRFDQVHELRQALKDIGEKHKTGEITFGSPVSDFHLSDVDKVKRHDEQTLTEKSRGEKLEEKEPAEAEEEKGFLDFIVEGTQAAEEMTAIILEITRETLEMGNRVKVNTESLETIGKASGLGTAAQVRKVVLIIAGHMNSYSDKIEARLPKLDQSIEVLTANYSSYVAWLAPKSEDERKSVAGFRNSVSDLFEGTKNLLKSLRGYKDSVAGLKGISRETNLASRRLTGILGSIISAMERVEAFCVRTLPLIDEKLKNNLGPETGKEG